MASGPCCASDDEAHEGDPPPCHEMSVGMVTSGGGAWRDETEATMPRTTPDTVPATTIPSLVSLGRPLTPGAAPDPRRTRALLSGSWPEGDDAILGRLGPGDPAPAHEEVRALLRAPGLRVQDRARLEAALRALRRQASGRLLHQLVRQARTDPAARRELAEVLEATPVPRRRRVEGQVVGAARALGVPASTLFGAALLAGRLSWPRRVVLEALGKEGSREALAILSELARTSASGRGSREVEAALIRARSRWLRGGSRG